MIDDRHLDGEEWNGGSGTAGIDLAHEPDFSLGELSVSPSLRNIIGPGGEVVVEPKVMLVLVALTRPLGKILSKDDLIDQCWEGRIVGDASINRVVSLLRSALREVAGDGVVVDTVPKVGYRVLVKDETRRADEPADSPASSETDLRRAKPIAISLLTLLALLFAAFAWAQWTKPLVKPITMAMVPMELSEEVEPLFGRGLESELRSELGRRNGITVSAPESAEQLALEDFSAEDIGQRLNVDYVVVGRIESTVDQIALTLEAVDIAEGKTRWSQTISSTLDEARLLPQRAARSLLEGLSRPFETPERASEVSRADYATYLSAISLIDSRDPQNVAQAMEMLEQVVDRNPKFSQGWSGLAKARWLAGGRTAEEQATASEQAREMANRALLLDENSVEARKIAGLISPDSAERHRLLTEAVELDPGDAEAWFWLSHVSAHPDYAGGELEAIVKAARLDPLWDRTWQASAYAASAGKFELADELDRNVIGAAAHPWQRNLAEGRIKLRKGDVSEFMRLAGSSFEAMPRSAKQVTGSQLSNMRVLLGLEPPQAREAGLAGMIEDVAHGVLPSKEEFEREGITSDNFWRVTPISIGAPSLFIRDGRTDELLRYYDEGLGSPKAVHEFGHGELRPHHIIPNIAIYIGKAMEIAGRNEEAEKLYGLAEVSVSQWQKSGYPDMTATIFEANLAAARGERERAIDAVRALVEELGWPYALQSPGVALQGPLLDDPAWADLKNDPELKAVLQPVIRSLARERDQLGF